MANLFLSTDSAKHSHIVYIRDGNLPSITSVDGKGKHKHAHNVMLNPNTGQWEILEYDGHTHEIKEEISKEIKDKDESDKDIISQCYQLWCAARDIEASSRRNGAESEKFINGRGQWEEGLKTELEGDDRAALTINEIEGKIDIICGFQRQNRTDIRTMPVEDGDSMIADILNVVIKNVLEQTNYDMEESLAFENALGVGRGFLHLYVDYDQDINGKIVIEKFPWNDGYAGPHEKLDMSDCEYFVKARWYSKAYLSEMWPDKIDELNKFIEMKDLPSPTFEPLVNKYDAGEETSINYQTMAVDADYVNIARKEFRILEVWRKEYIRSKFLVNSVDGFVYDALGWSDADIRRVLTIPDFKDVARVFHRMRVSQIAGPTLLNDYYPVRNINGEDYYVRDFPIVPIYGKKMGNDFWGKVEPAKDLQREINKRHSQLVDILNKVAVYGFYYDSETFDRREEENFKQNASSPGWIVKVKNLVNRPIKEEGVKFPNEIVAMAQMESEKMRDIMNIPASLQGITTEQSGVAIKELVRRGIMGNVTYFDNLSYAKKQLGRLIIKTIQEIYDPKRILRIIDNEAKRNKELELGGRPVGELALEEVYAAIVREIFGNEDLVKYDVVVSESAANPTMRAANFTMLLNATQYGVPIDPVTILEYSDLPDKNKLIERTRGLMESQAQAESEKRNSEVQKAAIAAQAKVAAAQTKSNNRTPMRETAMSMAPQGGV